MDKRDKNHRPDDHHFDEKTWKALGAWKDQDPDPGYVSRFWTRLAQEQSWQEKLTGYMREWLRKMKAIPSYASVIALLIVGLLVSRHFYQTQRFEQMLVKASPEEVELVENIELVQNLEVIEAIDLLEDMDFLESFGT